MEYDTPPLDDFVPTANINTVTTLFINNLPISDLTGIEDFAALEILIVKNTNLTSLDVSSNSALIRLDCQYNQLTSVNVSGLVNLEEFILFGNSIATIDVSSNSALTKFNGGDNPYTSLDFSCCVLC